MRNSAWLFLSLPLGRALFPRPYVLAVISETKTV